VLDETPVEPRELTLHLHCLKCDATISFPFEPDEAIHPAKAWDAWLNDAANTWTRSQMARESHLPTPWYCCPEHMIEYLTEHLA